MLNHSSSRFRYAFRQKDLSQKSDSEYRGKMPLLRKPSGQAVLPEVADQDSTPVWTKRRSKAAKIALVCSLILHLAISSYLVRQIIRARDTAKLFEELVAVEFVPPPPVKMNVRKRQIPKAIPKVVKSRTEAPSTLTTRVTTRAPQQISEVIVKGPEIVRESVEVHRDAPISQLLPEITTAARFEAKTETRNTIAPPVATPTAIAAPGAGIVTNRVRVTGEGEERGLSDVNSYGTSLRGGSGFGDGADDGFAEGGGLGDGFADVGTTPPKIIQINPAADQQAKDLFGIGEYVTETRGDDSQEIVYLLDVSSSMKGDKLRLAIQALKDALSLLYQGDTFNIVTFDKDVRVYQKQMLPVNRENVSTAYRFLDGLKARAGTNLSGGLERALTLEASTIVVISDGDPSRGITKPSKIRQLVRRRNTSHARIMTIALGHGHSDDGVRLLKDLAAEHDGQLLLIDLR